MVETGPAFILNKCIWSLSNSKIEAKLPDYSKSWLRHHPGPFELRGDVLVNFIELVLCGKPVLQGFANFVISVALQGSDNIISFQREPNQGSATLRTCPSVIGQAVAAQRSV